FRADQIPPGVRQKSALTIHRQRRPAICLVPAQGAPTATSPFLFPGAFLFLGRASIRPLPRAAQNASDRFSMPQFRAFAFVVCSPAAFRPALRNCPTPPFARPHQGPRRETTETSPAGRRTTPDHSPPRSISVLAGHSGCAAPPHRAARGNRT